MPRRKIRKNFFFVDHTAYIKKMLQVTNKNLENFTLKIKRDVHTLLTLFVDEITLLLYDILQFFR